MVCVYVCVCVGVCACVSVRVLLIYVNFIIINFYSFIFDLCVSLFALTSLRTCVYVFFLCECYFSYIYLLAYVYIFFCVCVCVCIKCVNCSSLIHFASTRARGRFRVR